MLKMVIIAIRKQANFSVAGVQSGWCIGNLHSCYMSQNSIHFHPKKQEPSNNNCKTLFRGNQKISSEQQTLRTC